MRSQSWAILQGDHISFDFAVRWAADRGMTEIEVQPMLFLRFTSPTQPPPPPPPPISKTLPLRADIGTTGQGAINVFLRAFGAGASPGGSPWYVVKLIQAGLSAAGIFTAAGRAGQYTVPPYFYIEDMTGLDGGNTDRQKLLDALK